MQKSIFIPISKNDIIKTEIDINKALIHCNAIADLCIATDPYKYMIIYDDDISLNNTIPDLGVKIIKVSENMKETEKQLNEVMNELRLDDNKSFVSICHPSDYIYIILYEYRTGYFPTVSIVPIIGDLRSAQIYINKQLEEFDEVLMDPCGCIRMNDNNMILLLLPR